MAGFRSNIEHDRLKVIALVRIGPSCKEPEVELKWRVTFGGGKLEGKAAIQVDLEADASDMSMVSRKSNLEAIPTLSAFYLNKKTKELAGGFNYYPGFTKLQKNARYKPISSVTSYVCHRRAFH